MKLSIIIPSLRADKMENLAKQFAEYCSKYEIIVISPNEINVENTVWIKEDKPAGIYKAVEKGLKKAKGDYILHMPDDMEIFPDTINNALKFMDWKKKTIVGFKCVGNDGLEFEIGGYFGKIFASCPLISRKTLKYLDNILMDTYYTSFYGDPDLSLRLWVKGGKVEICKEAKMYIHGCHDEIKINSLQAYEDKDKEKFIKRWETKLGPYTGYQQYR